MRKDKKASEEEQEVMTEPGEMDLRRGAQAYQRGDYEIAIDHYKKAAYAGNITALSNLGYCYYYGRSVPVDMEKAQKCWEQAAIFGDVAAIYKLGDMYWFGDIEQNKDYAYGLYIRAFNLASTSEDIYTFPDVFLRLLRYFPDQLEMSGLDAEYLAEKCVFGLRVRIDRGDQLSDKLLSEAEDILEKLRAKAGRK